MCENEITKTSENGNQEDGIERQTTFTSTILRLCETHVDGMCVGGRQQGDGQAALRVHETFWLTTNNYLSPFSAVATTVPFSSLEPQN